MVRILFICNGNTSRSAMAEAIARERLKGLAEASSAGVRSGSFDDKGAIITTLKKYYNIDASGHTPRNVEDVDLQSFDIVIAMSSNIRHHVKPLKPRQLYTWNIHDPIWKCPDIYRKCAKTIENKIEHLDRDLKKEVEASLNRPTSYHNII